MTPKCSRITRILSKKRISESCQIDFGSFVYLIDSEPVLGLVIRRDVRKTVKMKLKRGDTEVVLNVELKKPEG